LAGSAPDSLTWLDDARLLSDFLRIDSTH